MKKRVLIVYHFIALYRKSIFEELDRSKNIDYYFACDKQGKENIETVKESFFVNKNYIKLKNYWFKNLLWQRGLITHILTSKYDSIIFLADPNFITTWIASFLGKKRGAKIFFWTHGFIRNRSFKEKIKLFFYKLSDGLLLYGAKAKENLINYGVSQSKLFPIYNSLDYTKQRKIREKSVKTKNNFFKDNTLPQIVFIGRLTSQKKLDILIHLLLELEKYSLKTNLLFIGDGIEKNKLEKLVISKKLSDRVFFYGKTYSEEEITPLIMSSDVCISPGEIGLTAMHVLAYGVPIITHDDYISQMPEYEAVIDNITGKLFKKDDFGSLVNVTLDFFNNQINNVSENCINIIEKKYTPKVQKELIEKAILSKEIKNEVF